MEPLSVVVAVEDVPAVLDILEPIELDTDWAADWDALACVEFVVLPADDVAIEPVGVLCVTTPEELLWLSEELKLLDISELLYPVDLETDCAEDRDELDRIVLVMLPVVGEVIDPADVLRVIVSEELMELLGSVEPETTGVVNWNGLDSAVS